MTRERKRQQLSSALSNLKIGNQAPEIIKKQDIFVTGTPLASTHRLQALRREYRAFGELIKKMNYDKRKEASAALQRAIKLKNRQSGTRDNQEARYFCDRHTLGQHTPTASTKTRISSVR